MPDTDMPRAKRIVPLYHQIYLTLRNELLAGHYSVAPGAPVRALPGEMDIAASFGASRVTVRRALQELEQEGLIVRRPGAGTFPAVGITAPTRYHSNLDRLYGDLLEAVEGYQTETLEAGIVPTPRFVRDRYEGFDETCFRLHMVSRKEDKPVHLSTQYVPLLYHAKVDPAKIGRVPLLVLLERTEVRTASVELGVSATSADIYAADRLDVAAGSPLISVVRNSMDAVGDTIEIFEAVSRPDLYLYTFRFDG
jgi:GntR family transcriptional regulator